MATGDLSKSCIMDQNNDSTSENADICEQSNPPTPSSRGSPMPHPRSESEVLSSPNLKVFTFYELIFATENFDEENLLGSGGFGFVYKGWLKKRTWTPCRKGRGAPVAVKRLQSIAQDQGHQEWLTELNYLSQLDHPNLIKMIGYAINTSERLMVYEYMEKGSLYDRLRKESSVLRWSRRLSIATDIARALAYLHGCITQILFLDAKSANVLLNSKYVAKLSDFGLARPGPTDGKTHTFTRHLVGTNGYTAPEYILTGTISAKSDVFSYGVILLELLTGKLAFKPPNQKLTEKLAPRLKSRDQIFELIDERLSGIYVRHEAFAVGCLASRCIDENPYNRPTMIDILTMLSELRGKSSVVTPRLVRPLIKIRSEAQSSSSLSQPPSQPQNEIVEIDDDE